MKLTHWITTKQFWLKKFKKDKKNLNLELINFFTKDPDPNKSRSDLQHWLWDRIEIGYLCVVVWQMKN